MILQRCWFPCERAVRRARNANRPVRKGTTSALATTSLLLARWDDLKLDRRLATQASAVSARSNDVLERSEVGAFTMGQEAGSVSEPQERAPPAILFLPTGVSTDDQNLALQLDALNQADCRRLFRDVGSGSLSHRPEFDAGLQFLSAGDTLVVWRLDRLGRGPKHLIEAIENLHDLIACSQPAAGPVDGRTAEIEVCLINLGGFQDASWAFRN